MEYGHVRLTSLNINLKSSEIIRKHQGKALNRGIATN